jgi:ERCC4-type nuclease
MKIYIDSRETALYDKCILNNDGKETFVEIESKSLPLGDILIETDEGKPVWLVERKTLQDLLASIKDGRYNEQSYRLEHTDDYPRHNILYVIEGMYSTLPSFQHKKVVLSTMASLSLFKGFSVFRTCNIQETAELLIWMADKVDRKFQRGVMPHNCYWNVQNSIPMPEMTENKIDVPEIPPPSNPYVSVVKKVKKENINEKNIGEIMLCSIPGISASTASCILEPLGGSVKTLIYTLEHESEKIESIMIGKRKISKTIVQKLKDYLLQ